MTKEWETMRPGMTLGEADAMCLNAGKKGLIQREFDMEDINSALVS